MFGFSEARWKACGWKPLRAVDCFPASSLHWYLKPSLFFTLAWLTGQRACTSVFPYTLPFMYINIAKETPVYTVTCFGQTDIYLLLYNEGNLHSALKIWPHWPVLPLPQWFLHGERPQSTEALLYSASQPWEDVFRTCTLASFGA